MSKNWIIGIVVVIVLIVAFVYLRPSTPATTDMTPPPPVVVTPPSAPQPITVILAAENKSGEAGTATVESMGNQTKVTIALTGASKAGTQPAHFHTGTCATPGPIKYPLTSVVNGASVSTLDITFSDFMASLPLILNVHKSAAEIAKYVACGGAAQL